MNKIKICINCGNVFGYTKAPAYINNECISCHYLLKEIDVDANEFMKIMYPKGRNYNYTVDEANQNRKSAYQFKAQIFEQYIEPLGQLDTSLTAYKLNMESYGRPTNDIDEIHKQIREKAIYELHEGRRKRAEENLPKCPTCSSTNIRHISSTERGVNAVMFGFFGNKRKCQFECLNPNCKYRW